MTHGPQQDCEGLGQRDPTNINVQDAEGHRQAVFEQFTQRQSVSPNDPRTSLKCMHHGDHVFRQSTGNHLPIYKITLSWKGKGACLLLGP